MLYQEYTFDNIDEMLDMKVQMDESLELNKEQLKDMYVIHDYDIKDNVYKVTAQSFYKYALN